MGRPTALQLTPGQASDLQGIDGLAQTIQAQVLITDKGYDAHKRVRAVLAWAGKTAVIAPRRNRKRPATYDKDTTKSCTKSAI
jgi:IS5 family transposase